MTLKEDELSLLVSRYRDGRSKVKETRVYLNGLVIKHTPDPSCYMCSKCIEQTNLLKLNLAQPTSYRYICCEVEDCFKCATENFITIYEVKLPEITELDYLKLLND